MGKIENLPDDDQLLNALDDEKYIKEAEELERKAMEGMDDFPFDPEDEQRRFRAIFEELRERGLLTEEEEQQVFGDSGYLDLGYGIEQTTASNEKIENNRDNDIKNSKNNEKITRIGERQGEEADRKRKIGNTWKKITGHVGKCAAVAAIVCGSVFAMSMTSEANRQYVKDTVSYAIGGDTIVKVSNGDESLIRGVEEYQVKEDIEKKLGVSVPIINYRPQGMSFEGYEIYEQFNYAILYYNLNDYTLVLYVASDTDLIESAKLLEGKNIPERVTTYNNIEVQVLEDEDGIGMPTYTAYWEFNNTYFQLNGKIKKEELKKILKKITY